MTMPTPHLLVIVVFWLLGFGAFGCKQRERKVTARDIGGIFVGNYHNGLETIEMRQDGTFRQVFVRANKVVYSIEGNWVFRPPSSLSLSPFTGFTDMTGVPSSTEVMVGVFAVDPDRIELGQWPYVLTRKANAGGK